MAHFAEITNGFVVRVTVVNNEDTALNGIEDGAIGAAFCHNLLGGEWVQTSFNTHAGLHAHGKTPLRKNYAGIGFTYDTERNAFIAPQPYASWVLNESTCVWEAPVPYPATGRWQWDESVLNWVEI